MIARVTDEEDLDADDVARLRHQSIAFGARQPLEHRLCRDMIIALECDHQCSQGIAVTCARYRPGHERRRFGWIACK
jgi:hypothetical protein